MRTTIRWMAAACVVMLAGGPARAEEAASSRPAMGPEQQAAMERMQVLGSPGEGHKALEPLAGEWTYTARMWISPDAAPSAMSGRATNRLIFEGRFLQQEVHGEMDGRPFAGFGFIGYDNIRREYQSMWIDNMATGMMQSTGQYDAAARTLTDQGNVSCPMTGEPHRWYRGAWTVVDENHTTYDSYARTPDGREFKAFELHYTRAQ